jgi:class 3 adenylate cyclase/tetratricopeptide (TPR) repeat protein
MPAAARHCSSCGQSAPLVCRQCGQACAPQARFCGFCGAAVDGPPGESAAPSPLRPSERKLLTIMFVDMIGSLAAIRDSDPEEAHDLFSRALGVMTAAVHSCGGTVVRTLGDGLMVLFGAPSAREDHAVAACHAALRIVESIQQVWASTPNLNVRIGLHSGLVVVGQAANDLSMEYDATGVAVHIASRLQNAALPGTAVMTAATQKLVAHEIETHSLGLVAVKGLEEPLEIFELRGPRQQHAPASEAVERVFVGRASELAELAGALRSTLLGKGRFVGIVGEAGVGKSSFIERFLELQGASIPVFRATLERYAGTVPFHPIRHLLSSIFGLAAMPPAQRHEAVQRHLEKLGPASLELHAPLADLLETGAVPPDWPLLNPDIRSHMTIAAVRTLLLKESEQRPLVLIIEDIQRADSATLNLLGILADAIAQHRILLLASFRPDFNPAWSDRPAYRTLRLDRLNSAEADELIDRLVAKTIAPGLRHLLANHSQGNPLFLRETIRTLVDAGILGGEAGARRLLREPGRFDAPASVTAMIAERVDRLPPALKDLLLSASVLGEQFPPDILAEFAGRPADSLRESLRVLEAHELIRQVAYFPKPLFAFRHALIQEVCYSSLLKRRRRELHALAFNILSSNRVSPPAIEQLAHHSFRGGLWEKAVEYCRAAGRRALYLSANREAVRLFENAIAALARADPEGLRLAEAIDVQLELRAAHVPLLHMEKVGQILNSVHAAALRLGDRSRLAQITGFMAGHAYLTQNPRSSRKLCLTALRLAGATANPSLLVAPHIYLGQALHALGHFRKSVAVLKRNLAILSALDPQASLGLPSLPLVMTGRWIALSLAELGHFEEAEKFAHVSETESRHQRPFDQVYSKSALGFVLLIRGDYERARDETAEALGIADQRDIPFMIPVVASQLGLLQAYLGNHDESLQLTRRAVRTAEDIGISAGRSRWYTRLGESCLLAGDAAEAARYAQMAIDLARQEYELGYACYAIRLRGAIALASGQDIETARADILDSQQRAQHLGMAPLAAKCALDLAMIERKAGQPALARRYADQAIAEFRRLGMAAWAERMIREFGAASFAAG